MQLPDVDTDCDTDRFTATVREVLRARATPSAAVYIAWDALGRCRYAGSVRRPSAGTAVRDRLREQLGHDDRRAGWYALTVLPLRPDLDLDRVRLCEGWVARLLAPLDGSAHPMISAREEQTSLAARFAGELQYQGDVRRPIHGGVVDVNGRTGLSSRTVFDACARRG